MALKVVFQIMLATFLLLFSTGAFAERSHRGARDGLQSRSLMRELNLTQDQMQKIRELRKKNMPELRALRSELNTKQKEFAEAFAKGAEPKQLRDKNAEILGIRGQLSELALENVIEMTLILTPEQRVLFATRMERLHSLEDVMIPRFGRGSKPSDAEK